MLQRLVTPIECLCAWGFIGLLIGSCVNAFSTGFHHLKQLHSIPCSRCLYFTGHMPLKCTVHPCIALTEQAIHCRDYDCGSQM